MTLKESEIERVLYSDVIFPTCATAPPLPFCVCLKGWRKCLLHIFSFILSLSLSLSLFVLRVWLGHIHTHTIYIQSTRLV